jgi:hypothetical protein
MVNSPRLARKGGTDAARWATAARPWRSDIVVFDGRLARDERGVLVPKEGHRCREDRLTQRANHNPQHPLVATCRDTNAGPDFRRGGIRLGGKLSCLRTLRDGEAVGHAAFSSQNAGGIPYTRSNSTAFVSEGTRFPLANSLA